jgi:ADP-heptose:LPS heptosyltransferase
MKEKYIVWHIEGGLGKNIAATSLLNSLKEKHPERKIVVVASYPEIFLNLPSVYRVYKLGSTQYFYDDYIKNKDTIVFKHEPYYETHHILKNKHLIENWCKILDIEYKNQTPVLNFNLVHQLNVSKWNRDKPILLIQTNGGPLNSNLGYSWTRDIHVNLTIKITDKYKESHHIIQICKPTSLKLEGAEIIDYPLSAMELFTLLVVSDKRVLIDSSLQHAAAALNVPSTVFWIGTSPKNFGYALHNNIIANPPTDTTKLIDAYLFDYSFEGITHECPYYSLEEMFDVPKILEKI